MKAHMDKDKAVRLKYASRYASLANYWKNRQGMIDALTAHKTANLKRAAEKKFAVWANKPENKAEYGNVLTDLATYFEKTNQEATNHNYLVNEETMRAGELILLLLLVTPLMATA